MANIRKTQTRGDQTLLSNFRVDSDAQTYLKKDAETNTIKNAGTQYKAEKEKHSIGIWLDINKNDYKNGLSDIVDMLNMGCCNYS